LLVCFESEIRSLPAPRYMANFGFGTLDGLPRIGGKLAKLPQKSPSLEMNDGKIAAIA